MRACWWIMSIAFVSSATQADPPPVYRQDVIRRAQTMFDKADTNHDGILTLEEYHRALAAIVKARGGTPSQTGWALVDAQFKAVDQSGSGRVSRAQFIDAAVAHMDGADLNHDGIVTADEARKAAAIKRRMIKRQEKAARAQPAG